MLPQLIKLAENKAGSQQNLAKKFGLNYRRLCEYKNLERFPKDILICQIADFVGLNPLETLLKVKQEQEPENAKYWQKIMVRSAGLEPTPQASEFQKAHQFVTIIYNLLAYFVQRVQVSSVIKVGIPFS